MWEEGVGSWVWVWEVGGECETFCASENRLMHSYRATDCVCACVQERIKHSCVLCK